MKVEQVEVGMGATLSVGSDRYPATIIKVETINKKIYIHIQEDDAVRIDNNGFSESQEYEYTRNENAYIKTYRLEANGRWQSVRKNDATGRWNKGGNGYLHVGERSRYYDFSF